MRPRLPPPKGFRVKPDLWAILLELANYNPEEEKAKASRWKKALLQAKRTNIHLATYTAKPARKPRPQPFQPRKHNHKTKGPCRSCQDIG